MKRAKKKDIRKKYLMSEKQLLKEKEQVVHEAVSMTGLLYLSVLAEKGWKEKEILDLFDTVSRYVNYIDEHLVTVNQVKDTIEKHTGMKLKGW